MSAKKKKEKKRPNRQKKEIRYYLTSFFFTILFFFFRSYIHFETKCKIENGLGQKQWEVLPDTYLMALPHTYVLELKTFLSFIKWVFFVIKSLNIGDGSVTQHNCTEKETRTLKLNDWESKFFSTDNRHWLWISINSWKERPHLPKIIIMMVQNNQESRRKYGTTCSTFRSFACTVHSSVYHARLASLAHSDALICLLARSLTHSRARG